MKKKDLSKKLGITRQPGMTIITFDPFGYLSGLGHDFRVKVMHDDIGFEFPLSDALMEAFRDYREATGDRA